MRDLKKMRINLNKNRILVVSDIHGGIDLLKKNLDKLNYSEDDNLFILGDAINRGENSLETFNYIYELSKKKNVYLLRGNHEEDFVLKHERVIDKVKFYCGNKTSLLHDMCKDIDYMNMSDKEIIDYTYINYKYLYDFASSLPDIIETDKYIFAHSGLLEDNTVDTVLRTPDYIKYDMHFKKILIVGHYPTCNYPTTVDCISNKVYEFQNADDILNVRPHKYFYCNPMYFKENKIMLIDGGKGVKDFGQVNMVEIKDDTFNFVSSDNFKVINVINYQKESGSIAITYKDDEVEVIENRGELSLCKFKGKEVLLESRLVKYVEKNDIIVGRNNCFIARNSSDYFLELKPNDKVSLIHLGQTISQIKKDGIVGYAYNTNLDLTNI